MSVGRDEADEARLDARAEAPAMARAGATADELAKPRGGRARLWRNRKAAVSLALLALLVAVAAFGPLFWTRSGTDVDLLDYTPKAFPSATHPLGTDSTGIDTLARLLLGLRTTFEVALFVEAINVVLGVGAGVLAGYFRGPVDAVLSRVADLLFAFPGLLFVIFVAGVFGPAVSSFYGGLGRLLLTAGALALVGWPLLARYVRGVTLSLREQEFVLAARATGVGPGGIIRRHILPNVAGVIVVAATLDVVGVVSGEATLSLLGLGIQPPGSSLGLMINDAREYLTTNWTQEFFPCVVLALIILLFSFLGDGLRDVLDPQRSG
jgi:oligopeptide transport system permease protein